MTNIYTLLEMEANLLWFDIPPFVLKDESLQFLTEHSLSREMYIFMNDFNLDIGRKPYG